MRRTDHAVAVARALLDADGPVWGYDLTRRSGVPSGRLYPLLGRLLDAGWLAPDDDTADIGGGHRPPRRYYRLTDAGRDELARLVNGSA